MTDVRIGDIRLGEGHSFIFIGGPDILEGEAHALRHAAALRDICRDLDIPFVFKISYDKANRMSARSYRGPGLKAGLKILKRIKTKIKVPVLTDAHSTEEFAAIGKVVDVVQVPAFLCRQTDLVVAAAETRRTVNLKKGQFMAPKDMRPILEKVLSVGNPNVMLTERGTTFGYNNLVVDMRSLAVMRSFGHPVLFDAGHSVQQPGTAQGGTASGGEREMIPVLARAAVAAGCDGLYLEVHEDPDHAPCDSKNMLKLEDLPGLLGDLRSIHATLHLKARTHGTK